MKKKMRGGWMGMQENHVNLGLLYDSRQYSVCRMSSGKHRTWQILGEENGYSVDDFQWSSWWWFRLVNDHHQRRRLIVEWGSRKKAEDFADDRRRCRTIITTTIIECKNSSSFASWRSIISISMHNWEDVFIEENRSSPPLSIEFALSSLIIMMGERKSEWAKMLSSIWPIEMWIQDILDYNNRHDQGFRMKEKETRVRWERPISLSLSLALSIQVLVSDRFSTQLNSLLNFPSPTGKEALFFLFLPETDWLSIASRLSSPLSLSLFRPFIPSLYPRSFFTLAESPSRPASPPENLQTLCWYFCGLFDYNDD